MLANPLGCVVGRSIIDYDNFKVSVVLKENGLEVPYESVVVRIVESRDNHTCSKLFRK